MRSAVGMCIHARLGSMQFVNCCTVEQLSGRKDVQEPVNTDRHPVVGEVVPQRGKSAAHGGPHAATVSNASFAWYKVGFRSKQDIPLSCSTFTGRFGCLYVNSPVYRSTVVFKGK